VLFLADLFMTHVSALQVTVLFNLHLAALDILLDFSTLIKLK